MTTVFLIRHGEIDNPQKVYYGRTINLPLSEEGKQQIRVVAQRIKDQRFNINKIYSSPLGRTIESSKIISDVFNLPPEKIILNEDLTEVDIPSLVGKPLKLKDEIYDRGTDEYEEEFIMKGHESKQNIVDRMKRAFKEIVKENSSEIVAIVSHGDPMAFLLDAIEHSDREVKPIKILNKQRDYPQKGQAVKIVLDENGKFVSKESI